MTLPNMLTDVQKAYVAGFIDGEACIRVQFMKVRGPAQYVPQVKIAAVKSEVLEHMIDWYKGSNREYQPHSVNGNANRATEWTLQGRVNVLTLMRDILPYVIVKKPQVELMIRFITEGEPAAPPKPVSATEIARRASIFEQFKVLNKRGKDA